MRVLKALDENFYVLVLLFLCGHASTHLCMHGVCPLLLDEAHGELIKELVPNYKYF